MNLIDDWKPMDALQYIAKLEQRAETAEALSKRVKKERNDLLAEFTVTYAKLQTKLDELKRENDELRDLYERIV